MNSIVEFIIYGEQGKGESRPYLLLNFYEWLWIYWSGFNKVVKWNCFRNLRRLNKKTISQLERAGLESNPKQPISCGETISSWFIEILCRIWIKAKKRTIKKNIYWNRFSKSIHHLVTAHLYWLWTMKIRSINSVLDISGKFRSFCVN